MNLILLFATTIGLIIILIMGFIWQATDACTATYPANGYNPTTLACLRTAQNASEALANCIIDAHWTPDSSTIKAANLLANKNCRKFVSALPFKIILPSEQP